MRSGRPWPRRGRYKPRASQHPTDYVRQPQHHEFECMICLCEIGRRGKIWNCDQCRKSFHLACTQKWQQKLEGKWQCPACNGLYCHEPKYMCYCGKIEDPLHNPSITPHSCGDVCGRRLGENCPHKCTLLCHTGVCPPCTAMSLPQTCCCGKTTYQILCRDNVERRTCSAVCSKVLNCGLHTCAKPCHLGQCDPCMETALVRCKCSRRLMEVRCGIAQPSCNERCGRTLSCGNHECLRTCHTGACQDCELAPNLVKTCFCGKQSLDLLLIEERKTCLDPIPSCYAPCLKPMACGHPCTTSCHKGDCPPCRSSAEFSCRCGREQLTLPCVKQNSFLCTIKCKAKMSCQRHRCEQECCPGYPEQHLCTQTCRKTLNCTRHTCISLCHIGACELCPILYRARLSCPCGKTYKDPPIACDKDTFTFNCPKICGKPLDCGHGCASLCHDGPCPRCIVLTDRPCNCRREVRHNVQCSLVSVSCGKVCKEQKSCGHFCDGRCHIGSCPTDCLQPCRSTGQGCGHICGKPCHRGKPCPQTQCKVKVHMFCPCGRSNDLKMCYEARSLECNETCLRLEQAEKIAASETIPVEDYTAELVDAGRQNMSFLKTLEKKVAEFIRGDKHLLFMPPMKAELRELVHNLLRKHYYLDSESFDQEPNRSVIGYRSSKAKIPRQLLSEFIDEVDRGLALLKIKTVVASLLFYNLSSFDPLDNLTDILSKYEDQYYIEWANDHSANAHFYNLESATEAFRKLVNTPGPYAAVKMKQVGSVASEPETKRKYKSKQKLMLDPL